MYTFQIKSEGKRWTVEVVLGGKTYVFEAKTITAAVAKAARRVDKYIQDQG